MTVQATYGFACLIVGAILILGQILILMRAQVAAARTGSAFQAAQLANSRSIERLDRVQSLLDGPPFALAENSDAVQLRAELTAAATEVASAGEAVDAAKDVTEDWRTSLVSNLSSRVPLATAGIVLIVLGAVINGYLEVAAGN